jgi:hypothetical protein
MKNIAFGDETFEQINHNSDLSKAQMPASRE